MSEQQTNPYVGPRTFEEKDAPFFYGREREARDLLAFVISEPLVLFYAQSGAGKSSLINTSLIPNLRQEGFEVLPVGRVGGNLPKGISDVRNIYTFSLLTNLDNEAEPAQFTQTMLTDYLESTRQSNGSQHRVLIIDQFEEIVTNHPGRWRDREDFFWQLQAAMQIDPFLWVVFSMREDHIAALEPFAEILPNGLHARFYMQRLKLESAETAVQKPALKAGKSFNNGVAKELVNNLSLIRDTENRDGSPRYGEYVEPVQLQVVCYQLWENLKGRSIKIITSKHVEALGNVDRALADFYDTAVDEVVKNSNTSEINLRNWFEQELITEAHTRGTVYQGEDSTEGLANEAVNQLADKYLLRAERRAGAVWYELVHDRFVEPILQANQNWRASQPPLVRAAIAWQESGEDEKWLMTSEQVQDELQSLNWQRLDKNVHKYVVACGRKKHEEQRKEEILQRQLDRATYRIRRFRNILAMLLIIALLIAIMAVNSSFVASRYSTEAQNSEATAHAQATKVQEEYSTLVSHQSTRESSLNFSFQATATANQFINQLQQDSQATEIANLSEVIGVATEQAIRATRVQLELEAENMVAETATTQAAIQTLNQEAIVFVRYPPNFDVNQGVIFRINADGSNEIALTGSGYSSRDPAWSPDGSQIIFSSNIDGDYDIYVMDASGPTDPSQWIQLTNNSSDERGPAWSPNGLRIAFFSDRMGINQIYRMNTDGSNQVQLYSGKSVSPDWAPSSLYLTFGSIISEELEQIATMREDGSDVNLLTPANQDNFWPSWSPTGQHIAYTHVVDPTGNTTNLQNIYIYDFQTGTSRALREDLFAGAPDWSPRGNELVFFRKTGPGSDIWIMDTFGENLRQVTSSGANFDTQPKWSP